MRPDCVHWRLIAFFSILASVFASPVAAGAQESRPNGPARLSVLAVCARPQLSEPERGLMAELELALDGYTVIAIDSGHPGFGGLEPDRQVELIRDLLKNAADTSPVLWMDCFAGERVAARLLVARGGAATVRTLEAGSLAELALVVREMVVGAGSVASTTEAPARDGAPDRPARDEPRERASGAKIGILTAIELGGGLVGETGSSFVWGGGIAADAVLARGFFGRLAALGKMGPRAEAREFLVVGHRVEARVEAGHLWKVSRLEVGPLVSLAALWSSIDFALTEGHHQRSDWWSVRFAFGADARLALTDRLSVVLDPTVGFMPKKRFYRRSSKETLLETPAMDTAVTIGLAVRI